eukprot:4219729-Lingulodinium_polyedra.AAC.1
MHFETVARHVCTARRADCCERGSKSQRNAFAAAGARWRERVSKLRFRGAFVFAATRFASTVSSAPCV